MSKPYDPDWLRKVTSSIGGFDHIKKITEAAGFVSGQRSALDKIARSGLLGTKTGALGILANTTFLDRYRADYSRFAITAAQQSAINSLDLTKTYGDLFRNLPTPAIAAGTLGAADISTAHRTMLKSLDLDLGKNTRNLLAGLNVNTTYSDMFRNLQRSGAFSDTLGGYKSLLATLDTTAFTAAMEGATLATRFADVIASLDLDLEDPQETIDRFTDAIEESIDGPGGLTDLQRGAIATYCGIVVLSLIAAAWLHHPKETNAVLAASTPLTIAWAITQAIYKLLGNTTDD